jgi:hypothetical protein
MLVAAAGSAQAADYFPLATGDIWNYTFSATMLDSTFTGPLTMVVAGNTMVGPDSVYKMKIWSDIGPIMDTSTGYYMARGNDILVLDSLGPPVPFNKIFEHYPQAGERWINDNGETLTVVYYGAITVPAGTFDSCYATVDNNGGAVYVFAPNVGLVKMAFPDSSRLELTSYSVRLQNPVVNPVPNISHASEKPGLHQGRYSLLNAQGRCIDIVTVNKNGALNRSLGRGTYFLVEKDPGVSGVKRAVKLCVSGK